MKKKRASGKKRKKIERVKGGKEKKRKKCKEKAKRRKKLHLKRVAAVDQYHPPRAECLASRVDNRAASGRPRRAYRALRSLPEAERIARLP